jgi:hypothetical protein
VSGKALIQWHNLVFSNRFYEALYYPEFSNCRMKILDALTRLDQDRSDPELHAEKCPPPPEGLWQAVILPDVGVTFAVQGTKVVLLTCSFLPN